jgi:hypothetical protein
VPTRVLSAADVRRLLDRDALLESLRAAFAAYSTRRTVAAQRAGSALPGPGGRTVMVVYPGLIDGIPAFTVKVNAKIPGAARSVVGSIHLADLETGARRANELRIHLNQLLSNQPVEILAGNRVLEIRPHGVHKGRILPPLSPEREARTTIVAIGDDRTDEDLFTSLPPDAISVKVGPGATRVGFRLDSTSSVRALLQMLVETGVREHLA